MKLRIPRNQPDAAHDIWLRHLRATAAAGGSLLNI